MIATAIEDLEYREVIGWLFVWLERNVRRMDCSSLRADDGTGFGRRESGD